MTRYRASIAFFCAALVTVGTTATSSEKATEPWIVFGSFRGGDFSSSIHAVRPDGTGERQLSPHPKGKPASLDPRVAPDGAKILFSRGGSSHRVSAWIMDSDGKNERRLTDEIFVRFGRGRAAPSMSPDGRLILYCSNLGSRKEIRTIDLNGGNQKTITEGEYPHWSPGGTSIAFVREEGDTYQVWTANADGSSARRVTGDLEEGYYPSWSPDGEVLLFSRPDGDQFDLWTMKVDGSDLRRLTRTKTLSERRAVFSPDGKFIAFEAKPADSPDGWQRSIFVIASDGTGPARQITPSLYNDTSPSWMTSP